jgi:hypothetical protein
MRMLAGLHDARGGGPGRPLDGRAAAPARRWPWAVGGLAVLATPVVVWGLYGALAGDAVDAGPATVAAAVVGDAAGPVPSGAASSAAAGMSEAASAVPDGVTATGGPARLELAAGEAVGVTAALAASGAAASAPVVVAQREDAAPVTTVAPAPAPLAVPASRPAAPAKVAKSHREPAAATRGPRTGGTAAAAGAREADPDAELVAAIMARLEVRRSGDGELARPAVAPAAGERGVSIAALVRDCNALPDSASALACRRRICEGYWGKAQACPKTLAPGAAARADGAKSAS